MLVRGIRPFCLSSSNHNIPSSCAVSNRSCRKTELYVSLSVTVCSTSLMLLCSVIHFSPFSCSVRYANHDGALFITRKLLFLNDVSMLSMILLSISCVIC